MGLQPQKSPKLVIFWYKVAEKGYTPLRDFYKIGIAEEVPGPPLHAKFHRFGIKKCGPTALKIARQIPLNNFYKIKGGGGCPRSVPSHITTVFLATNTYCMMDSHSSCAPRTVGPKVPFSGACEQLSVVQAATNTERLLNPVLANGHILKRTPSNPLCRYQ